MRTIAHTRGDTFRRDFPLENTNPAGDAWTFAMFSEIKWTMKPIGSDLADDSDAIAVASSDDGAIYEDPGDETLCWVRVEASETIDWPAGRYRWDLQGRIDGSPVEVYSLDSGEILVTRDVGRTP